MKVNKFGSGNLRSKSNTGWATKTYLEAALDNILRYKKFLNFIPKRWVAYDKD